MIIRFTTPIDFKQWRQQQVPLNNYIVKCITPYLLCTEYDNVYVMLRDYRRFIAETFKQTRESDQKIYRQLRQVKCERSSAIGSEWERKSWRYMCLCGSKRAPLY